MAWHGIGNGIGTTLALAWRGMALAPTLGLASALAWRGQWHWHGTGTAQALAAIRAWHGNALALALETAPPLSLAWYNHNEQLQRKPHRHCSRHASIVAVKLTILASMLQRIIASSSCSHLEGPNCSIKPNCVRVYLAVHYRSEKLNSLPTFAVHLAGIDHSAPTESSRPFLRCSVTPRSCRVCSHSLLLMLALIVARQYYCYTQPCFAS